MRKILLKTRQLGKNNLISCAAEVLAWTLGWKPDTHCIEEKPLILYTNMHQLGRWVRKQNRYFTWSLNTPSQENIPLTFTFKKSYSCLLPKSNLVLFARESKRPKVFSRGHDSLPGTAGFLNKCSSWSLGIQAPSRYDSIARISWNIGILMLAKEREELGKKLRISFRIIHLMHMTQEVHIREMTLAGSWSVLT